MIGCVRAAGRMTLTLALLLIPIHARAAPSVALAIHAGYSEYAMTDVNQDLITHTINEVFLGGSGFALKEIHGGISFGAGHRRHVHIVEVVTQGQACHFLSLGGQSTLCAGGSPEVSGVRHCHRDSLTRRACHLRLQFLLKIDIHSLVARCIDVG